MLWVSELQGIIGLYEHKEQTCFPLSYSHSVFKFEKRKLKDINSYNEHT
jgi:hypothetical protein